MAIQQRTILVVEDDKFYSTLYTQYCDEVLKEMSHLKGSIIQAFNYNQARQVLDGQPADFISVDIALTQEEEGKTDEQRKYDEAGGMILLKQLQETNRPPLAVVVSGETLQSYAIDAYQEYGILAFYQKDRFDIDQYKQAVKAALWYLDAADLLKKTEIEAAISSWNKARAAAKVANIKEKHFPEDIGANIKARWTHPATGLPDGHWTQEKLRNKIVGRKDWGPLIQLTFHGFSEFISKFASQEEAILTLAGNLLNQFCKKYQDPECFIGHLGYSKYTYEPSIVIILDQPEIDDVTEVAALIKSQFEEKARVFLSEFEATEDQPKLTLLVETKVLESKEHTFEDLHRLLDTLGAPRF